MECVMGLIVGWCAGRWIHPSLGGIGGETALVVLLGLLDELVASTLDKNRGVLRGLMRKAVFCGAVLWMGGRTGAPLASFAEIILLWSIFRRYAYPDRGFGKPARV